MTILTATRNAVPRNLTREGNPINEARPGVSILERLARWVESSHPLVRVDDELKLTKGVGHCDAWLLRKSEIEKRVRQDIQLRIPGGIGEVVRRYGHRYHEALAPEWPAHFGVDVLGGRGPVSTGANVFAFFPGASGVPSTDPRHQFGFEFLNVWQQVFDRIVFPAARLILDTASQCEVQVLLQHNVADVAYLGSVLHELGHRVGPFRVSPAQNSKMALPAGNLQFDACGELTTDSLGIALLPELPAWAACVTLYRLLFFPRRLRCVRRRQHQHRP